MLEKKKKFTPSLVMVWNSKAYQAFSSIVLISKHYVNNTTVFSHLDTRDTLLYNFWYFISSDTGRVAISECNSADEPCS